MMRRIVRSTVLAAALGFLPAVLPCCVGVDDGAPDSGTGRTADRQDGGASGGAADAGLTSGIDRLRNLVCQTSLTTSGSFSPGAPNTDGVECWPDGVWTISAALRPGSESSTRAPALQPQYQIRVTVNVEAGADMADRYAYQYLGQFDPQDPANMFVRMKVSGGGGGLCDGELQIFSPDGTQALVLHAALRPDNSLSGLGNFSIYSDNEWQP